jgi:transcriptional regulator with XRE-family HTH domain
MVQNAAATCERGDPQGKRAGQPAQGGRTLPTRTQRGAGRFTINGCQLGTSAACPTYALDSQPCCVFELSDAAVVHQLQTCPPDVRQPILVQLRTRAGLTQRRVASELEVSFGLVSHWERGLTVPGWPQLRYLARLYGASLDCVATAVGRRPPELLDQKRGAPRLLPEIVREVRQWRGESVADVAERMGVHRTTIFKWEHGTNRPTRTQLDQLEAALGLRQNSLPRVSEPTGGDHLRPSCEASPPKYCSDGRQSGDSSSVLIDPG